MILLCMLSIIFLSHFAFADPQAGIHMRLTDQGLRFAMKCARDTFVRDLKGKSLRLSDGRSGKVSYSFRRGVVNDFGIPNYNLESINNVGIRASLSNVHLDVSSDASYKFKQWFIKIADSFNIRATTNGARFQVDFRIGRRNDGRPSISVVACSANVGSFKLRFSKSAVSWLYNLLANVFQGKIKDSLNNKICDSIRSNVQRQGDDVFAKLEVKKKLDPWAFVDYSLAVPPSYKDNHMDIFLKGQFSATKRKQNTSVKFNPYTFPSYSQNMAYFGIADYFFNTAGDVYHNTGRLKYTLRKEDKDLSPLVKILLNTYRLQYLVPGLYQKYPNMTMDIEVRSAKPPRINTRPANMSILCYAEAQFRVLTPSEPEIAFVFGLDVVLSGDVMVQNNKLVGKIKNFDFKSYLKLSKVGKVDIPVYALEKSIETAIQKQLNEKFAVGLPLPKLTGFRPSNPKIKIMKNVVLLASDFIKEGSRK